MFPGGGGTGPGSGHAGTGPGGGALRPHPGGPLSLVVDGAHGMSPGFAKVLPRVARGCARDGLPLPAALPALRDWGRPPPCAGGLCRVTESTGAGI